MKKVLIPFLFAGTLLLTGQQGTEAAAKKLTK